MIISIAGAFGYFGVPALWGLLRVFFRQIGGSVDDLRPDYSMKDIERETSKKRSHRYDDEMQINSNEEDILIDDTEEQGDDLEPRSK